MTAVPEEESLHAARRAEEAALMVRLADGDTDALRRLMAMHWSALVAVALVTTNSPDLARDAVQDAFIQLWDARAATPPRNVLAYLITVVRRRAIDLVRHEQMHQRIARTLMTDATVAPSVSRNAGEAELDRAELEACLTTAIAQLPPRCREMFLLHHQAHLSYPEIAAALGVSVPTVWNQMAQATRRLSEAVARYRAGQ
jgi:RNA polymerase sigma-70 factor (ECF subfamily)